MILSLQDLHKSFGSLVVTDGVSLEIREGQALGILGPNGAGKSTLFNLITGNLKPNTGKVVFKGQDVTSVPANKRCALGIGRSFQIPKPFEDMTVFENLLVAGRFGAGLSEGEADELAIEVLAQTGLIAKANQPSSSLTLLDRKRLELARAMATKPELLLLDEIAGGLTEAECHSLVDLIRKLNKQHGITIVWIEHVVHALLEVVDELLVLDYGKVITKGQPEAVMNDPHVQSIYMGADE